MNRMDRHIVPPNLQDMVRMGHVPSPVTVEGNYDIDPSIPIKRWRLLEAS